MNPPVPQQHIDQLEQQVFATPQQANRPVQPKQSFFKNKKFIYGGSLILILLILTGVIVAIYGQQKPATPTQSTVTFWGRSVDKEVMDEIINDFESKNPLIKIQYERQIDTNYKERVATRLKLGNTPQLPDIVEIEEPWVDEISPYLVSIDNPEIFSKYSNVSINNNKVNGSVVAIPYKFDSLALAFNKQYVQEINLTEADFNRLDWSSLLRRAESLTKIKKTTNPTTKVTTEEITRGGMAVGSPATVTNADKIFQLLLIQNDANIYDVKNKKFALKTDFDEVSKFYTNFALSNVWDNTLGNDIEAFSKGKVAMAVVRSKDIDQIKKLNPSMSFVTVLPARIGLVKNISLSTSLAFPAVRGANFEAASKFVNYLTTADTASTLFASKNSTTFIPSQLSSLSKIPQDSPYYVFANLNSSAQKFVSPNYEETSLVMQKFLQQSYQSYDGLKTNGQRPKEFRIDRQTLEVNLNNILKPKTTPTAVKN